MGDGGLACPQRLGKLADSDARRRTGDLVQQANPGGFSQAGEPARVERGVRHLQRAGALTDLGGQQRAGDHACHVCRCHTRHHIDEHRWLHRSMFIDTVFMDRPTSMKGTVMSELPVVIVGAGPIGLAAAAELRERGLRPLVIEQGSVAGSSVAQWNHVRLFSPWSEVIAPAAQRLLQTTEWVAPEPESYPTGSSWSAEYLSPLAAALGDAVQFDTEVIGV